MFEDCPLLRGAVNWKALPHWAYQHKRKISIREDFCSIIFVDSAVLLVSPIFAQGDLKYV